MQVLRERGWRSNYVSANSKCLSVATVNMTQFSRATRQGIAKRPDLAFAEVPDSSFLAAADLILRTAHCHSSRVISSFRAETNDFGFVPRDTETAVVSDLMSRKRMGTGVRLKRRGKRGIESDRGSASFPI